ncbi:MAG: hypothetical protein CMN71_10630 [Sphingomonadaceae bacterium]|nr:hypothetical protein [Sphingomonadaceae bacterium]
MIEGPVAFHKFAASWAVAALASVPLDKAAPQAETVLLLGGVEIPIITAALGLLGVACARFLALPKERSLGTPRFLVVSLLMVVAVQLWIVEARPGWLFAFVLSIGLGFSGFSLIELLGDQVKETVKAGFEGARGAFAKLFKTSKDGDADNG